MKIKFLIMFFLFIFSKESYAALEENLPTSSSSPRLKIYVLSSSLMEGMLTSDEPNKIKIRSREVNIELSKGDSGAWSILNMSEAYPIYNWREAHSWQISDIQEAKLKRALDHRGKRTIASIALLNCKTSEEVIGLVHDMKKYIVGQEEGEKASLVRDDGPKGSLCKRYCVIM